jgi:hypothetical protein
VRTPQLDLLLADGRVRQIKNTDLYVTIRRPLPAGPVHQGTRYRTEEHLKATTRRTRPSLTSLRHQRRAKNRAARRARKANR